MHIFTKSDLKKNRTSILIFGVILFTILSVLPVKNGITCVVNNESPIVNGICVILIILFNLRNYFVVYKEVYNRILKPNAVQQGDAPEPSSPAQ